VTSFTYALEVVNLTEQSFYKSWKILSAFQASCWDDVVYVDFLFRKPLFAHITFIFKFLSLVWSFVGPSRLHFTLCNGFPPSAFLPKTASDETPECAFCHTTSVPGFLDSTLFSCSHKIKCCPKYTLFEATFYTSSVHILNPVNNISHHFFQSERDCVNLLG